jgi:sensor c-di-GMP phosphodiesterase-like protein
MITESRVYSDAVLKQEGSDYPWRATMQTANIECNGDGVYQTNVGAVTGCREAMGYYLGVSGARMLGASMPFYDSQWTITVEQEAEELMQPLYELLFKVSAIGILLALLASAMFVFVINHYVFRPLSNAFDDDI